MSRKRRTNRNLTFAILVAATGVLGASAERRARAQAAGGCFPPCRSGFICSPAAQCVSACNPACPAGQECAADGQCVAGAAPPASTYPSAGVYPPATGAYPSAGIYPGAPPANAADASPYPVVTTPRVVEDAKERRRTARAAWSLYGGLGGGETKLGYVYGANGSELNSLKHQGATFTVGVGVRKYFTRIMGMQARGSLLVGEGKGLLIAAPLDATLRLGPFGQGFPWFFGLGVFAGSAFAQRTATDYSTSTTGVSKTGSTFTAMGGGVAETGFLFGEGDRIEVAARSYVGTGTSTGFGDVVEIVVGMGYRF